MAFSSGIYRRLHFGINIENDRSESVSGSNSPEISENVLDDAISQSSKGKRKLCDDVSSGENVASKDDSSASVYPGGKAARRSPRIAVKALKKLLVKKTTQAEELSNEKFLQELKASSEVKVLMDLERKISLVAL